MVKVMSTAHMIQAASSHCQMMSLYDLFPKFSKLELEVMFDTSSTSRLSASKVDR